MVEKVTYLFKSFKSKDEMTAAAVDFITERLEDALADNKKAGLVVSGGSSPRPIYQALSRKDIAWENISVGLVDERWVEPGEAGSNQDFIHETLLQNKAQAAAFVPMKTDHAAAALGAPSVTASYEEAFRRLMCVSWEWEQTDTQRHGFPGRMISRKPLIFSIRIWFARRTRRAALLQAISPNV